MATSSPFSMQTQSMGAAAEADAPVRPGASPYRAGAPVNLRSAPRQARACTANREQQVKARPFPRHLVESAAGHGGGGAMRDAVELMESANAEAREGLLADMRAYALANPRATLADWGRESEWARDTGGEGRVQGGVWEVLWEQTQSDELSVLRRLREGAAAAESRDAALAECAELNKLLDEQSESQRQLRASQAKLQARLHTVLEAREDEQRSEGARAAAQEARLQQAERASESLRRELAERTEECAQLRQSLAYHVEEQAVQRDAAMRTRTKLSNELKAAQARASDELSSLTKDLALDSAHWQGECEKMCLLLAQAEDKADFFKQRTECLIRAAAVGGASVVNALEASSPSTANKALEASEAYTKSPARGRHATR